jgi:hypothetical protein
LQIKLIGFILGLVDFMQYVIELIYFSKGAFKGLGSGLDPKVSVEGNWRDWHTWVKVLLVLYCDLISHVLR